MTFVRLTYTAYPLAPNNGHASESSVEIVDHQGVVATLAPTRHLRELHATRMAAGLDGVGTAAVERQTWYRYRDNRNEWAEASVTPTSSHIRFARACQVTRAEYDSVLGRDPERLARALEAITTTLDERRTETFALAAERAAYDSEAPPETDHRECDLNDTDHPQCEARSNGGVRCQLCEGHDRLHVNGRLGWED